MLEIDQRYSLSQIDEVLAVLIYVQRKLRMIVACVEHAGGEPHPGIVLAELEELDETIVAIKKRFTAAMARVRGPRNG